MTDSTDTGATGSVVLKDPTGLHARPAVKLTKLAKSFAADIGVRAGAEGDWVNAKSPNSVMKLKAPIKKVTPPHTPVPFAPELEDLYIPQPAQIEEAVRAVMSHQA